MDRRRAVAKRGDKLGEVRARLWKEAAATGRLDQHRKASAKQFEKRIEKLTKELKPHEVSKALGVIVGDLSADLMMLDLTNRVERAIDRRILDALFAHLSEQGHRNANIEFGTIDIDEVLPPPSS